MVRKIIWSKKAIQQRKDILAYWSERNQSDVYSKKLNTLLRNEVKILAKYPNIGRMSDIENVRIRVIKNYLLFYQEKNKALQILSIWDNRQNPEKMKTY